MKPLSSVGLGLSVVFGCLFFALVAELYYLLWWKKRCTSIDIEKNDYKSFYMFCWKNSSSSSCFTQTALSSSVRISDTLVHDSDQSHFHTHSSDLLKPFGEENNNSTEEELMRLQNLSAGTPRFLFTIVEETKEDLLESDQDDGKGSRSRSSLNDLRLTTVETPFVTPLASPTFFTTPPHHTLSLSSLNQSNGFNPLFESVSDAEFSRLRSLSSPPPKFKFLQEAEEKLRRKLKEEGEKGLSVNKGLVKRSEFYVS